MQIILTKEEYDDLVKKATAAELIAEEKFEELKRQLREQVSRKAESMRKGDFMYNGPSELIEFLHKRLV